MKCNSINNQLFTFNWPALITLIVNTFRCVRSKPRSTLRRLCNFSDWILFNNVVWCKWSRPFFNFSKLVSEMSNSVRGYLLSVMYLHNWLIHVRASCSHNGLSNPHICIRWKTSEIGYLKLLITWSILSGPLDFEIKTVTYIPRCFISWNSKRKRGFYVSMHMYACLRLLCHTADE